MREGSAACPHHHRPRHFRPPAGGALSPGDRRRDRARACAAHGGGSADRRNPDFRMRRKMDDKTRTELEAAAFRRLVQHLRERTDVQNIDLMNLAGFCRNCLSKWYRAAAEERGIALSDPAAREIVYGMPYEEWKAKHQKEATPDQQKSFAAQHKH